MRADLKMGSVFFHRRCRIDLEAHQQNECTRGQRARTVWRTGVQMTGRRIIGAGRRSSWVRGLCAVVRLERHNAAHQTQVKVPIDDTGETAISWALKFASTQSAQVTSRK